MQLFLRKYLDLVLHTNNFEWRNEYTVKTVKSFGESSSLIRGVSQTIKNEAKEQKGWFLSMLGILGASC